jgi:hypothetical protein
VTLDTYPHVIGGLQEDAAQRLDDLSAGRGAESGDVGKMSATNLDAEVGVRGFEPPTT